MCRALHVHLEEVPIVRDVLDSLIVCCAETTAVEAGSSGVAAAAALDTEPLAGVLDSLQTSHEQVLHHS